MESLCSNLILSLLNLPLIHRYSWFLFNFLIEWIICEFSQMKNDINENKTSGPSIS